MIPIDSHYTPGWLADEMVAAVPPQRPGSTIADLAAGRGALLDAASRRYGSDCTYIATDADRAAVQWLRRNRADWRVGQLDILSATSRRTSRLYAGETFNAVLLNPPFSCRGKRQHCVDLGGVTVGASIALAVTLQALERVGPGGVAVALLPSNTFSSEKDEAAWQAVLDAWEVSELDRLPDNLFAGVRAQVSLARLTRRKTQRRYAGDESSSGDLTAGNGCRCVEIIRGRVSMHDADRRAVGPLAPLVHTTNVQGGSLIPSERQTARRLATSGHLLVLPRIGLPSTNKLATSAGALVLSDCLFGLRVGGPTQLEVLQRSLVSAMKPLVDAYGGSCARYLTVRRLAYVLSSLGWAPHAVPADSPSWTCRCPQASQQVAL